MKLTVTIDSENDALVQDPAGEARRALVRIGAQLADAGPGSIIGGVLFDTNGGRVGSWGFEA